MAEYSTGLQTRQEERCVFWLLLGGGGGRFNIWKRFLALTGPQISTKNRGGGGVRLFGTVCKKVSHVHHTFTTSIKALRLKPNNCMTIISAESRYLA